MKYWYDTEFIENGRTIKLISIGIVAEDGRQYYAVNNAMPIDEIHKHNWLMRNVVPHLPIITFHDIVVTGPNWEPDRRSTLVKPRWLIASEVQSFLLVGESVELWANYGAYDHVVLAQLWGSMINLPTGIPMYTNDVQQEARRLGVDNKVIDNIPRNGTNHHALDDAHHTKKIYDLVMNYEVTGNLIS